MLCAAAANAPLSINKTTEEHQGGDGGCSIFMRPKCGAIGETLNAIAGFLRPILPISSGSICTNGEEHAQLERLEKREAKQLAVMLEV